jgi:hypothetical protein
MSHAFELRHAQVGASFDWQRRNRIVRVIRKIAARRYGSSAMPVREEM